VRAVFLALAIAALWPGVAPAQTSEPAAPLTVVTSAGPDSVSVTLYRDPDRDGDRAIDRDDPSGFALITETRTVTLPAGSAVIRFEGVAGNIMPESALVAGLPTGVEEKNLDASLLSPRSLFDRALGRRVMIRRTNPATGKVMMQQATIRSSASGAAVLQIAGEYTDYKCSGMPETLVYDGVPDGLSAKPTLSVRTTSPVERRVTLTLSYLAGGFDWQADYIIAMRPDQRSADLFAWITLASSDVTSFADAQTQVVAGHVNRESGRGTTSLGREDGDLPLKCWPMPSYNLTPIMPPPPPPVMAPAPMAGESMDIVVTGQRRSASFKTSPIPIAKLASAEQLGDLKLYRFPTRVTVASQAQKQVAMLSKPGIKLRPIYRAEINSDDARTWLVLRGKNTAENGLGVALPSGKAAVFSQAGDESLLVGESAIADKTVGEEIEFELGESDSVHTDVDVVREKGRFTSFKVIVTNSNPWPIDYEAGIRIADGAALRSPSGRLGKKDGYPLWSVTVPPNGTATLSYGIRAAKDEDD
jgi:hypothetical protein